jgi:two-component system sensor histidine kinase KdpD
MERLYAFSRAMMLMDSGQPITNHIAIELARIYELPAVAIYDRTRDTIHFGGPGTFSADAKLKDVSITGTRLPAEAGVLLVPINLGVQSVGTLGIQGADISETSLHAVLNLIAIALENARSREIATRAEAAKQSQEFKSTLLDGLAHEFKTPLTSIRAATTALLSSSVSEPRQRQELLTIVDQEAERLSGLVTEATHLTRIEAGTLHLHRRAHSINRLVNDVLEAMQSRCDGRHVEISVPADLPEVPVDIELMQLAFKQLVDNAVKYSPPSSPIRVRAAQSGGEVQIVVYNSGNGLSENEKTQIFEKFYRGAGTRRQVAGTGMGLSIAREILIAHGGDIRLNNRSQEGIEFVVTVPVHGEARV